MTPVRRVATIAVVLLLLVGGGLLDRRARQTSSDEEAPPVPVAAAADARSSAWYCAGATAKDGAADGTVVVANAGTGPLEGTLTAYPSNGPPKARPISVGPASRASVPLAEVVNAPFVSALVELDGGEAVVELAVTGPLGASATPCASAASSQWYFADGTTTRDATSVLFLFNPFPDDAVVDLVFGTEEGPITPQALTGLTVRGGALTPVNMGDFVQRREQATTSVRARAGRLVVSRLQTFDGSVGRKGMALTLGAAAPGDVWYVPEGVVNDGLTERYQIFNPTKQEAEVEIALALESGEAEPLTVTVPAESRVTVNANGEARIPKGVPHAATFRSLNGVGVVVERTIDAAPAARRTGLVDAFGARVTARRWCLAVGSADDSTEEYVVLQNPGTEPARVSLSVLVDGERQTGDALQNLEVGAGQRRSVRIADAVKRSATPVVVESDRPIVVERVLNRLKGIGVATSIGIPLR
jgi:Family of unknown function (DUF5719)